MAALFAKSAKSGGQRDMCIDEFMLMLVLTLAGFVGGIVVCLWIFRRDTQDE